MAGRILSRYGARSLAGPHTIVSSTLKQVHVSFKSSQSKEKEPLSPPRIDADRPPTELAARRPTRLLPPTTSPDATPEAVWRSVTERLLDESAPLRADSGHIHELASALRWWARQRPITAESASSVWQLYQRYTDVAQINTTLWNTVVDHWRLSIVEGLSLGERSPPVMWKVIKDSPASDIKTIGMVLSAMAHWPSTDPQLAIDVLDFVEQHAHLQSNTILWNSVLTVVAKHGGRQAPSLATQLLERMLEASDCKPNEITYASVLEAMTDPEQALHIIGRMREAGVEPNAVCHLHVLQTMVGCQEIDHARAWLQRIVDDYRAGASPTKPTRHLYSVVLSAYARQGQVDQVSALLAALQTIYEQTSDDDFLPTCTTMNSVLDALAKSRRPGCAEDAQALLERMAESSHPLARPDTSSLNTVLHAWAEASSESGSAVERAEALLQRAVESGIEPDARSYTNVIKAWARSDRPSAVDRCEAFLQAMWESDLPMVRPNDVTYATVLYAWSRSTDPQAPLRAEAVYHAMMERYKDGDQRLRPSEATYVTLMTAWNRSRRKEAPARVQYYFDQVRARHLAGDERLRPTHKVYQALIESKKRAGDGAAAERILEDMLRDGIRPTTMTFHSVMATWARSRDKRAPQKAEVLLMRMKELYEQGHVDCQPQTSSFTNVLNCWARSSQPDAAERAEAILRHMQALGDETVAPSSYCFATVLTAWSRSGHPQAPERAQALFQEMVDQYNAGNNDCRPSSTAFVAIMSTWARSRRPDGAQRALSILDEMTACHQAEPSRWERPDNMHYSAVINAFAQSGDVEKAQALLDRLNAAPGVAPHTGCYNGLIKAIVRSPSVTAAEDAEAVLRGMQQHRYGAVTPDVVTYSSCIAAWQTFPDPNVAVERAEALLQEAIMAANKERNHRTRLNIAPNASTFLAFLRVLARSTLEDRRQRAQTVLSHMQSFGLRPTKAIEREVECCQS